jgi:type IV secretory pathway VirB10-like protein
MNATFRPGGGFPAVTRLRLGRLLFLLLVVGGALTGGTLWLLGSAKPMLPAALTDSTAWPPWLRQAQTYPAPEAKLPVQASAPEVDKTALELAKLRADLLRQQQELEELKRRGMVKDTPPTPTRTVQPRQAPPMLYVSHEVKDAPSVPKTPEYALAPGATKLPCVIETAINSDVEGYFTAKVSANVYDTATGRHLLVPQGSTILGHDQSSALLYGNERLPTISLTLALPDGRSVDLGHAPVTDQQGVAGLTGKVDQHFWRLFGAVFIGGALRGGTQALQVGLTQAGPLGQVASGVGGTANQATQQRLGRALDTRPTITVESGQLCHVLLTKPLTLPALWH